MYIICHLIFLLGLIINERKYLVSEGIFFFNVVSIIISMKKVKHNFNTITLQNYFFFFSPQTSISLMKISLKIILTYQDQ